MINSQSSKNALKHGFYAAEVVLPSENQQEFDDLLRAYQDEYCPDGVSEEAAVRELAILHWKKRRLETGLRQALQKLDFDAAADTSDPLGDIARAAAKPQLAAVRVVCDSLQKQAEQVGNAQETKARSLLIEFEKLAVALKKYNRSFKTLASSLRRANEQKVDQIVQTYLPNILEKELKIQAEIDRQIEKVLKRLVMTQEYKRLYCTKSVNENQIELKLPVKAPSDGF